MLTNVTPIPRGDDDVYYEQFHYCYGIHVIYLITIHARTEPLSKTFTDDYVDYTNDRYISARLRDR